MTMTMNTTRTSSDLNFGLVPSSAEVLQAAAMAARRGELFEGRVPVLSAIVRNIAYNRNRVFSRRAFDIRLNRAIRRRLESLYANPNANHRRPL